MNSEITPSEHSGKLPVIIAVCLAGLILPLNFISGAIATPSISHELGGSPQALSWITNAFMLSFGCVLMAAGALADEFGRKRVFVIGVTLFAVLSLLLVFCRSLLWIDLLRAAQGVAAAATLAGGSAALAQEFEGKARTRAFSLLGTSFGVGLAFGPLLAGILIDNFGWRSVFLTSVLVALLSLTLGARKMHESRNPQAAGIDWPGTLSFTSMLALLTWGLMAIPAYGLQSKLVMSLMSSATLLLVLFIWVELRVKHPMLDLSLFRYPRFIGVQVLPLATAFCFVVLLVILPVQLIGITGLSAEQAGWVMMALSLPMLVIPLCAAWLTHWFSVSVLCCIGLLLSGAGLWWLSEVVLTQSVARMVPPMLLIGLGVSLPWGLMDGLSVSVVPKERAGMATGIFSTTRVAGEGISMAMVGVLLSAFTYRGLTAQFSTGDIAQASQRLATGGLQQAQMLLPQASKVQLQQIYAESLHQLLIDLLLITLASALVIFFTMSRQDNSAETSQPKKI